MKKWITMLLVLAVMLSTAACGKTQASDLMEDVPARIICLAEKPEGCAEAIDFSVRLLQNSLREGQNTLISPLSVRMALAMTANGAEGETRSQMEAVLGASVSELNAFLYDYTDTLPQGDAYRLHLANSVWFNETAGFEADPEFLRINADYYHAGIFCAPFNETTCGEINDWVTEHTDGRIRDILDEIPAYTVMYLINALSFDAQWETPYEADQVNPHFFTREDGTQEDAVFMVGEEDWYLEDDSAVGFLKPYQDDKYAFVALLPNEGISVADYAASLTGAHLQSMLENMQSAAVETVLPKFTVSDSVEMSEILTQMGMGMAFDPEKADFSGLGTSDMGNIYINRVLHKTFISVGEKGTEAAASTVVEMRAGGRQCPGRT